MPTEIVAVTCAEGVRTDVFSASSWVDVMCYHESDIPGSLLLSSTKGGLLTSNSWSIPRQVPTMPLRLAPGTQLVATSLSGSRILQMVISPVMNAPEVSAPGAVTKASELQSENPRGIGRTQGPVSPLVPQFSKR